MDDWMDSPHPKRTKRLPSAPPIELSAPPRQSAPPQKRFAAPVTLEKLEDFSKGAVPKNTTKKTINGH